MAEVHPTSATISVTLPPQGSTLAQLQNDVDTLKQENKDLRTMLESLMKEFKDLKKVKAEATTLGVPPAEVRVKTEPLEAVPGVGLGESPTLTESEDAMDHEQIQAADEEQERMEADGEPGNALQDTGDAGERIPIVPSRYSTEEPVWVTPPCTEVLFRVNPEYARRVARANGVFSSPVQVPTPPPQPHEETPPPLPRSPSPPHGLPSPPPRLPTPAPTVYSPRLIGIIPASQAKRKHNFELIIETPSKRSKAFHGHVPSSSWNRPVASSSRATLDTSITVATRAPTKKARKAFPKRPIIRKVLGPIFKVGLDPKIRDVAVTRDFVHSYFGLHHTVKFAKLSEDQVGKHGSDPFVFICEDDTPQAPSAPGEPGLIVRFGDRPWPACDRYRVFVRIKKSPAKWQYMGLYKATKLPSWTPGEFNRQRLIGRGSWLASVRWGRRARPMLARVTLRQELGREPTDDEVGNQMKKLAKKTVAPPSLDAIIAAVEKGEEKADPWKLECEHYEEDLQRKIAIASLRFEKEKINLVVNT